MADDEDLDLAVHRLRDSLGEIATDLRILESETAGELDELEEECRRLHEELLRSETDPEEGRPESEHSGKPGDSSEAGEAGEAGAFERVEAAVDFRVLADRLRAVRPSDWVNPLERDHG